MLFWMAARVLLVVVSTVVRVSQYGCSVVLNSFLLC